MYIIYKRKNDKFFRKTRLDGNVVSGFNFWQSYVDVFVYKKTPLIIKMKIFLSYCYGNLNIIS